MGKYIWKTLHDIIEIQKAPYHINSFEKFRLEICRTLPSMWVFVPIYLFITFIVPIPQFLACPKHLSGLNEYSNAVATMARKKHCEKENMLHQQEQKPEEEGHVMSIIALWEPGTLMRKPDHWLNPSSGGDPSSQRLIPSWLEYQYSNLRHSKQALARWLSGWSVSLYTKVLQIQSLLRAHT